LDVTAIRAIIHEEMATQASSWQFYNQSAVQPPMLDPSPLSPASILMIANAQVTQIHPQLDNTHFAQDGKILQAHPIHFSKSYTDPQQAWNI